MTGSIELDFSALDFLSEVSAHDIVETVRDALLVLDAGLTVVSANRAFYSMFATTSEETIGRRLYDLGSGQWDIRELRRLLEEIIPGKKPWRPMRSRTTFPVSA